MLYYISIHYYNYRLINYNNSNNVSHETFLFTLKSIK